MKKSTTRRRRRPQPSPGGFVAPTKDQVIRAEGRLHEAEPQVQVAIPVLRKHFNKLKSAQPGDWLYTVREIGQDFNRYLRYPINKVTPRQKTIYIQPLEKMNETFLEMLGVYCQAFFFGCEVKVCKKVINIKKVKGVASRINENTDCK